MEDRYLKLFWLDLETTSLDPDEGSILEIAWATATLEEPFVVTDAVSAVLRYPSAGDGAQSLDPFILDMHTRNGLLSECRYSLLGVADVEEELLKVVPEISNRENMATLAGSSVHFDHAFLRAKMPRLAARFSHRHYDLPPAARPRWMKLKGAS